MTLKGAFYDIFLPPIQLGGEHGTQQTTGTTGCCSGDRAHRHRAHSADATGVLQGEAYREEHPSGCQPRPEA